MKKKLYCSSCNSNFIPSMATTFCSACGRPLCDRHSFSNVGGKQVAKSDNIATAKNVKPYCLVCYAKKYRNYGMK